MRSDVPQTTDRQETPLQAIAKWDGNPSTLELAQASENIVYRFREQRTDILRYLRLTTVQHRSRAMLEAELEFVTYLRSQRCDVAVPVPSRAAQIIETFATPAGEVYAVVFEAVTGRVAQWGDDAENRTILRERGRALGRIHRASKTFRPQGPPRFHWRDDDLFHHPEFFLPESDPALRTEYNQIMQWLRQRPVTPDNYGMIHGDFVSSNVLRDAGKAIAFDFDDCCHHWFAFDIAVAMWSGRYLPDKYRKPYLDCFLQAYLGENSLAGDTCREIEWFTRMVVLYRYTHGVRTGSMTPQDQEELRRVAAQPIKWC